jgi:metal-sulfur cluster biosynthetic enzyme
MSVPILDPHQVDAAPTALVDEIRRTLDTIGDPCSVAHGVPMGLDEMGLVEHVSVDPDGNVAIRLRLTSPTCVMVSYFRIQAEERVLSLAGVRSVEVVNDLGLDWSPEMMSSAAKARRQATLRARGVPTSARTVAL